MVAEVSGTVDAAPLVADGTGDGVATIAGAPFPAVFRSSLATVAGFSFVEQMIHLLYVTGIDSLTIRNYPYVGIPVKWSAQAFSKRLALGYWRTSVPCARGAHTRESWKTEKR
jgi:hypothetical protein